ncbi:hypothetical protein AgCh_038913 [Apium graveolens]
MANATQSCHDGDKSEVTLTPQQLQQLLKLIPGNNASKLKGYETEDELENCFSGMVTCNMSVVDKDTWIMDSGASDHMTSELSKLINIQPASSELIIKIPTGDTTKITHIGDVKLASGLLLKKVLYVPEFQNSLLSIHKVAKHNDCVINFKPEIYEILDRTTKSVKATGHLRNGLYYLKDKRKSDYLATMKLFYKYVEKHFNKPILTLRSDNAPEFADAPCKIFYAANGTLHQTSCVARPQQNARVERRHRTILEVARCLRFQSGLPLHPWGYCIMTAVYLINRLPTPVLDGSVERYKARLVILGCNQKYGIDYSETFAPVAKLTTVRALFAVTAIQNWHTLQMDVSNAFLNRDLDEHVYMKVPPGYTGFGSRISASSSTQSVKYILDLLNEYGLANVSPLKVPMETHLKLTPTKGSIIPNPQPYQRHIGKLIYLTVTRHDIDFPVHVLSQYMHQPTSVHMQTARKLLRYLVANSGQGILVTTNSAAQLQAYTDSDWANCPITRRSTSGFCVLLGNSPISWKAKKQNRWLALLRNLNTVQWH